MIIIYCGNLTLIITDACPADLYECAIRCLDHRGPTFGPQQYDDDHKTFVPRFSKFVGQMGRLRP